MTVLQFVEALIEYIFPVAELLNFFIRLIWSHILRVCWHQDFPLYDSWCFCLNVASTNKVLLLREHRYAIRGRFFSANSFNLSEIRWMDECSSRMLLRGGRPGWEVTINGTRSRGVLVLFDCNNVSLSSPIILSICCCISSSSRPNLLCSPGVSEFPVGNPSSCCKFFGSSQPGCRGCLAYGD